MLDLEQMTLGYRDEADVDYVGLWQIAGRIENELGSQNQQLIRSHALVVARGLMSRGVYPGDYTHEGFHFWPGTADEMANRIDAEWSKSGIRPNLADPICWFALRPSEAP